MQEYFLNISKLNPAIYKKDNESQPNQVYPWNHGMLTLKNQRYYSWYSGNKIQNFMIIS